jgi:hypothetical protein
MISGTRWAIWPFAGPSASTVVSATPVTPFRTSARKQQAKNRAHNPEGLEYPKGFRPWHKAAWSRSPDAHGKTGERRINANPARSLTERASPA